MKRCVKKGRLTARGFKYRVGFADPGTFAGTASRWSQRPICQIAVQNNWKVWSADVTGAFAKGMTFQEIAKLAGMPLRAVQLELTEQDAQILRKLGGIWVRFDARTHVLNMIKPVYGLKDAPKAWRMKLRQMLRSSGDTWQQ